MKTTLPISIMLTVGLALLGCARKPTNPNLVEARERFDLLRNKPESYWLAAAEVKEAFSVLIQADLLSNVDAGSPRINQLSQLARHKIALAEQAIIERKAEQNTKPIRSQ